MTSNTATAPAHAAELLPPLPLTYAANDAAKLLGISESHFFESVSKGYIHVVHFGRATRVRRDVLLDLLTNGYGPKRTAPMPAHAGE